MNIESLAKISKATKGENHPLYGRNHSPETKVLISKNHSRTMLGRTHSSDTLAKMSDAKTGDKNFNFGKYKKIFVYYLSPDGATLHKIFDNSSEVI